MSDPVLHTRALRDAITAHGGLLGQGNIAARLGVSRQRAGQLTRHDDFPEPVATVSVPGGNSPVWLAADIDTWQAQRRERLRKRRQRGTPATRHATLRGSQR